ncbi:bro-i [Leucania separata nucleopolyhedrovirus]|uniref:Bro-i n=1 Tax=Leucania separata nucleopolyhedrovirus TaxID=1307956 RepID=Q0IKW6_NPVLS|nr:bro-i [Leucania separata nucleopolyhedrovirus]AAR28917.1 bro-i [Leucania separata nucleopolyhedrovirus]
MFFHCIISSSTFHGRHISLSKLKTYSKMSVTTVQFANNKLKVVSIIDTTGQLWMLANPFARILEYSNAPNAISRFVSKNNWQCLKKIKCQITNYSLHPSSRFINKAGLLELVLKSRMRYAAEFRFWLVNELFPSLKIDALEDFEVWRVDPNNRQKLNEQLPIPVQLNSGCVYVVTNDLYEPLHLYKIGYTYNLKDRLSELNVASAYDFRAVFVIPTTSCRQLETMLHSKYQEHRVRREFFKLNNNHLHELSVFCDDLMLNKVE